MTDGHTGRPGAASTFTIDQAFDQAMAVLHDGSLGDDWPPQRHHLQAGQLDLDWPWAKRPTRPLQLPSNGIPVGHAGRDRLGASQLARRQA